MKPRDLPCELIFLGTGTSTGIPIPGCDCSVCHSLDSADRRLRSSIFIKTPNADFLVDTGPDLRQQTLRENISKIDFAIITHDHADHLHGIDDLRPFTFTNGGIEIPVYTLKDVGDRIEERFQYIFGMGKEKRAKIAGGIPRLRLEKLSQAHNSIETKTIEGMPFDFFSMPHGKIRTLGFRLGPIAYIIDCHEVPEEILNFLEQQKLEYLVIDCLKLGDHETHLTWKKSQEYAKRINAKQTVFTHISHRVSHFELSELAKREINGAARPARDGEKFQFSIP